MKSHVTWFCVGILVVFTISCTSQPEEVVVEKHPNGKPSVTAKLDETKSPPDTLSKTAWFQNGQMKIRGDYKNNKREGKWEAWYENGKLWSEGYFENGLSEGEFKIYNEDGSLMIISSYKAGKPHGKWTFFTDGTKSKEVYFENDSIINEISFE
jgi:antitoxin component YwqK of YwqJK toxin-antitoxin module